jgi:hypothetical protein
MGTCVVKPPLKCDGTSKKAPGEGANPAAAMACRFDPDRQRLVVCALAGHTTD